jgi:phage terminase large subunit-like protein
VHAIDAYARDVVAGRVLAGKYHRLACVRHQRDRDREATRAIPYWLDVARADRFYRFAENLRHYKGEWAGRPIVLEPHQKFRLGSIVGWTHRDTGLRRFRVAYNEIARKNGKSLEAAIIALYLSFFDGEPGSEGYCVATKRDQARIVFNDCKRLVQSSGLRSRIRVLTANLNREQTASKLEPLGADRDSTDGLNPHLVIIDEAHAMKTRGMIDVMETATGARRQPLIFWITTAGDDPVSPCGDQHDYACKVLERVIEDEQLFAFIAHADVEDKAAGIPADDWTQERTWRKANPNYGVSVKREDLAALANKAVHMTTAAAAFQQKRLNLWVNKLQPWLSLEGWRRGQTLDWTADDMRGQRCWIGVDLSSKIDLTAAVCVFPPTEGRRSWRLLARCLTPADTMLERARRDRAPYPQWVEQHWLETNPGNRIDQDVVQGFVLDFADQFDVQGVGVDPWNAGNLVADLAAESEGLTVVEVPQNIQQMSAPAKEFEADVLDGLVDAGGNPLLLWCASNAVAPPDNKDNIFPSKKRSRGRIDPIVAALIGRKLAAGPIEAPAEDPVLTTV